MGADANTSRCRARRPRAFKLRSSLPPRARRATARRLAAVPVWVSCPIRDLAIGISIIYGIQYRVQYSTTSGLASSTPTAVQQGGGGRWRRRRYSLPLRRDVRRSSGMCAPKKGRRQLSISQLIGKMLNLLQYLGWECQCERADTGQIQLIGEV